ncbi:MAG: cytochrome c [Solirubrobacteraceae bacterium]
MQGRTAALLGFLALFLAGCGSSGSGPSSSSALGHQVFTHQCSFCHSLSGHNSPRQQGGDLLGVHLRRPTLYQLTAEMPARHRLSRAELNAVVDYVLAVQRRSG